MEVLLFTHDRDYAVSAMRAGAGGIVVDWEWHGKSQRQSGADTEINRGTADDLASMRSAFAGRLICRVNNKAGTRVLETKLALDLGATEIWLPMVRDLTDVVECLGVINGKAELGVLVETREALRLGGELSKLPLSRAFVGLNDLRVDTGGRRLFDPLIDGTVEGFRASYRGRLGVAGITRPDAGRPIPQRLLLAEMARLGCDFGVARRTFRADVPPGSIGGTLAALEAEVARLTRRDAAEIARDHGLLAEAVHSCPELPPLEPACVP